MLNIFFSPVVHKKKKEHLIKILIECGPFLLNNKILHNSKISFINYDIDIKNETQNKAK